MLDSCTWTEAVWEGAFLGGVPDVVQGHVDGVPDVVQGHIGGVLDVVHGQVGSDDLPWLGWVALGLCNTNKKYIKPKLSMLRHLNLNDFCTANHDHRLAYRVGNKEDVAPWCT